MKQHFQFKHVSTLLGSLESFFQVDHQVDVSRDLIDTTAVCHSKELVRLMPFYCTFSPICFVWLLGLQMQFHFIPFHSLEEIIEIACHNKAQNKPTHTFFRSPSQSYTNVICKPFVVNVERKRGERELSYMNVSLIHSTQIFTHLRLWLN